MLCVMPCVFYTLSRLTSFLTEQLNVLYYNFTIQCSFHCRIKLTLSIYKVRRFIYRSKNISTLFSYKVIIPLKRQSYGLKKVRFVFQIEKL